MPTTKPTIFITGAAGGFGRAIARRFVREGWFVGLYDLHEAPLAELATELGGNSNATYGILDVTDPDSARRAVGQFGATTGGKLRALVNNAGIIAVGPFEEVTIEEHRRVIDVNLFGIMNVAYAALPLLRATPDARLINIASASALHGNPELVSYSASKRAVLSFTESLDIGWEGYGIRVSDILPMYAHTGIVHDHLNKFRKLSPTSVKLTPEDIAAAVWRTVRTGKFRTYVGNDTKLFAPLSRLVPYRLRKWVSRKVIGW
jgi:NAD(P)-dependent dehydrogenase (short-subunit alcohol dehydrogenase family)